MSCIDGNSGKLLSAAPHPSLYGLSSVHDVTKDSHPLLYTNALAELILFYIFGDAGDGSRKW